MNFFDFSESENLRAGRIVIQNNAQLRSLVELNENGQFINKLTGRLYERGLEEVMEQSALLNVVEYAEIDSLKEIPGFSFYKNQVIQMNKFLSDNDFMVENLNLRGQRIVARTWLQNFENNQAMLKGVMDPAQNEILRAMPGFGILDDKGIRFVSFGIQTEQGFEALPIEAQYQLRRLSGAGLISQDILNKVASGGVENKKLEKMIKRLTTILSPRDVSIGLPLAKEGFETFFTSESDLLLRAIMQEQLNPLEEFFLNRLLGGTPASNTVDLFGIKATRESALGYIEKLRFKRFRRKIV